MSLGVLKPRSLWKDDETRALIQSWKNHLYIKRMIKKGCSIHPFSYAMFKDLQKLGINRSISEIHFKRKNLERYYKKAKGPCDFRFYKEVDEIFKTESKILPGDNAAAEPEIAQSTEQPQINLDRSYVEGFSSENVQVIRLSAPDHQDISDSNPPSYTVISHVGPEVQHGIEVIEEATHPPQSSSSNSQEASNNILLSFYKEFERSNRQLEKNDAAMLELFKEQNDIFRTQTTLLMKLMLK